MRIGLLGGGQLARMLALAGIPMDLSFRILDPAADACARGLGDFIQAPFDDPEALRRLADGCDCVGFEFENVPAGAFEALGLYAPLRPAPHTLAQAQDRLAEKRLFEELGIPVAPWRAVSSPADLRAAAVEIGLPAVLKTRRQGYDGKGQRVLRDPAYLDGAWEGLGRVPCTLEGLVPFEREVSLVAVRGLDGARRFYPLSENSHREGILHLSRARPNDPRQGEAEAYMARLLEALDYVGVLALEFFEQGGRLLANEFAPRVHNSGHWTIEGAATSQFENHLRAITGLPLGDTSARGAAAMVNLVGKATPRDSILALPGAHLHLYGKAPRPGRKLGHVTLVTQDAAALDLVLPALLGMVESA
jgi:5-(carboxyamino)imidazole ribonucleotide synthase